MLHHNNRKDDQYRGSSSLTANWDGHLMVIGDSGSAQIILEVAKLKDFADDGQQFVLRRQIVELGVGKNGKPISSVVFERDLEAEAELAAESGEGEGLSPKEKTTLRVLTKLSGENNEVGIASNIWFKAASEAGVSKPTYACAKLKLLEEGQYFARRRAHRTRGSRQTQNTSLKPGSLDRKARKVTPPFALNGGVSCNGMR